MKGLLLAGVLSASNWAQACELPSAANARVLEGAGVKLAYQIAGGQLLLNQPMRLVVAACVEGGRSKLIAFDARMPEHGHGMNYRARIGEATEGMQSVDAVLLHMPGHWQFVFTLEAGGETQRLHDDLTVQP